MNDSQPVEFTEDRIPVAGIEQTIGELVDLYGGEMTRSEGNERHFVLPLRRGVPTSGGIECTLKWQEGAANDATVTLVCDRDVDAPKAQRIAMLIVGVIGAFLFMLWPFFPAKQEMGTLAWIGGAVAIAVYLMSLRKTSGGLAFDFLQRLARRQRALAEGE